MPQACPAAALQPDPGTFATPVALKQRPHPAFTVNGQSSKQRHIGDAEQSSQYPHAANILVFYDAAEVAVGTNADAYPTHTATVCEQARHATLFRVLTGSPLELRHELAYPLLVRPTLGSIAATGTTAFLLPLGAPRLLRARL